jgi:hypothetical protein
MSESGGYPFLKGFGCRVSPVGVTNKKKNQISKWFFHNITNDQNFESVIVKRDSFENLTSVQWKCSSSWL